MLRKIKSGHNRSAIDQRGVSTKLALFTSLGAAIIGLLSGLLGSYVGQRVAAVAESDKEVRAKLELSYMKTLSINEVAINLNLFAITSEVTPPLGNINDFGHYNDVLMRFPKRSRRISNTRPTIWGQS